MSIKYHARDLRSRAINNLWTLGVYRLFAGYYDEQMGYREAMTDSCVHVFNRGTKKLPIFREKSDLSRLLYSLYYFNTTQSMPQQWAREVAKAGGMHSFIWPPHWESRTPVVSILAATIMPNHLHLLLKEATENGISKFMHRVGMGYSKFINEKYDESGSLFQGTYKSRRVDTDEDLKNLLVYTMVKNPFELYPGGLKKACEEFDKAYEDALTYPLTSLAEYVGKRKPALLDHDLLHEIAGTPESFREFARETMLYRIDQMNSYEF